MALWVPEGFSGENLMLAVIQAFMLFARNFLTDRQPDIAPLMGLKPSPVTVTDS